MKNIFLKLHPNNSLVMVCPTKLQRIIVVDDFSPSSVKLKSGKFTSLEKLSILT